MNEKGKRRRRRNKRRSRSDRQTRMTYAASILALTALVGMAFFSPGWVFDFQDNIQCRDQVLEERENLNVAALSTNYESSYYQRMINFAKNPANTTYYVAEEELTDYDKLQDFLKTSEYGYDSGRIWALAEIGLITDKFFSCEVSEWKQYVIYSDDYTKGVNFILLYIKLQHPSETIGTYELLMEANTGEIYGVKADLGEIFSSSDVKYDRNVIYYEHSLEECLGFPSGTLFGDEWGLLTLFFSGLTLRDYYEIAEQYLSLIDGRWTEYENGAIVNMNASEEELDEIKLKLGVTDEIDAKWNEQWFDFLGSYPAVSVWDQGNRLDYVFPYGDGSLIFRLQMAKSVSFPWRLRDITVGFPEIYELIPEFQE